MVIHSLCFFWQKKYDYHQRSVFITKELITFFICKVEDGVMFDGWKHPHIARLHSRQSGFSIVMPADAKIKAIKHLQ
jgi:hypothetical protein